MRSHSSHKTCLLLLFLGGCLPVAIIYWRVVLPLATSRLVRVPAASINAQHDAKLHTATLHKHDRHIDHEQYIAMDTHDTFTHKNDVGVTMVPEASSVDGEVVAEAHDESGYILAEYIRIQRQDSERFWNRPWRSVIQNDTGGDVVRYLNRFETQCLERESESAILRTRNLALDQSDVTVLCPCVSGDLHGRQTPNTTALRALTWLDMAPLSENLLPGGHWKPRHCVARRRVAIIVPYRDREEQLRPFLAHMHPYLQRQLLEYQIFIVEQFEPPRFNKASLMNAGFLESRKLLDFDCAVFHDVDLLPEDDRAIFHCWDKPVHYACALDKWKYRLKYERLFGGVVSMTPQQFTAVNGLSNQFFGWGGEDDDFDNRVRTHFEVERPGAGVSRHTSWQHKRDTWNPFNPKGRKGHRLMRRDEYQKQGLNTVSYSVRKSELLSLYTHITIDLNVTTLSSFYERHIRFRYEESHDLKCTSNATHALSLISCQSQCDLSKVCFGFTYYHGNRDDHCHLMTEKSCQLTPWSPGVQTFLKGHQDVSCLMFHSPGSPGCNVSAETEPRPILSPKEIETILAKVSRHASG